MSWIVQIVGNSNELKRLAGELASADPSISRFENTLVLRSANIATVTEVHAGKSVYRLPSGQTLAKAKRSALEAAIEAHDSEVERQAQRREMDRETVRRLINRNFRIERQMARRRQRPCAIAKGKKYRAIALRLALQHGFEVIGGETPFAEKLVA